MKIIKYNDSNLKEEDITERVYRARAVIINSKNEVLLGYSKKTYQFPGGYLEAGETLEEGLKREIKEETGIEITNKITLPFYVVKYYNKDYPIKGTNRYTEFNYFEIVTETVFDLNEMKLDESEKAAGFELRYINLDNLESILDETMSDNKKNEIVYPEIKNVIKELRKLQLNKKRRDLNEDNYNK